MIKERLFERLTRAELPAGRDKRSAEDLAKESIVRHISKLLNTRCGWVPIDMNYGMSDLCNIAGSFSMGSVSNIQQDILLQIDAYESRFTNVKIEQRIEDHDVITLKFLLTGQIDLGQSSESVLKDFSVWLRVNAAGQVTIEVANGI